LPIYLKIIFAVICLSLASCSNAEQPIDNGDNSECNGLSLQVLGSGGPEIDDQLASSSYLIWVGDKARFLIDAGGGSSLNFEKSGAKFNDLKAILLSHLHVDHSAALPVYVKAGYFTQRESDLLVFGPSAGGGFPSTQDFIAALFSGKVASVYPYLSDNFDQADSEEFLVVPASIDASSNIWQTRITDQITLSAISVQHGSIPALAWRVDIGACSMTFSGDFNGRSGHLEKLAKDTNLLIAHNAIPENAGPVARYLHATPSIIGKIANKAQAKHLLLSHFMKRSINKKQQTLQKIRLYYAGDVQLAEDLQRLPIEK